MLDRSGPAGQWLSNGIAWSVCGVAAAQSHQRDQSRAASR